MRRAGLTEEALGRHASVVPSRILDAINYRSELTGSELCRLATVLRLNEIGLCALGCGRYPLPAAANLPFTVHPLRMRHGIGVANAYLVAQTGASRGVLFDTGPSIESLEAAWPLAIRAVDAVFLSHIETEHVGGLCEIVARFEVPVAYGPAGTPVPCAEVVGEGRQLSFGGIRVTTFSTPGHAFAHNCYLVEATNQPEATGLLVSGDLFFAGSVGCAHFCQRQLAANLRRMLESVPPHTVIAPGHGPMTTAANELRFNPFVL